MVLKEQDTVCASQKRFYLIQIQAANSRLDYMVVHARHGKQRSRDPPTWERIGEIKERAQIPIIGNGDVRTYADFKV